DLFGADLPNNGPWDPIPGSRDTARAAPAATRPSRVARSPLLGGGEGGRAEPAPATAEARALQASAFRRIWSTLLRYRDWVSFLYVPILVPILFLLPYVVVKSYQRSQRINQIVESLTRGSRVLEQLSSLLDSPVTPWTGEPPEEVRTVEEPDPTG